MNNTYQRTIETTRYFDWGRVAMAFDRLPLHAGVAAKVSYSRGDIIDEHIVHLQGFHQFASCSAYIYMCSFFVSDRHSVICVCPDPYADEYKKILGGRLRDEPPGDKIKEWEDRVIGLIEYIIDKEIGEIEKVLQ